MLHSKNNASPALSDVTLPSLGQASVSTLPSKGLESPEPTYANLVEGIYTTSKTWQTEMHAAKRPLEIEWKADCARWKRKFPESSALPWAFKEYLEYRARMLDKEAHELSQRIEQRQLHNRLQINRRKRCTQILLYAQPLHEDTRAWKEWGAKQGHAANMGLLARPTIFCGEPDTLPFRTKWPSIEEQRVEGDERVRTENGLYGRWPPLPRDYSKNSDAHWKTAPGIKVFELDKEQRAPPGSQYDDNEISMSMLSELLKEVELTDFDNLDRVDLDKTGGAGDVPSPLLYDDNLHADSI